MPEGSYSSTSWPPTGFENPAICASASDLMRVPQSHTRHLTARRLDCRVLRGAAAYPSAGPLLSVIDTLVPCRRNFGLALGVSEIT